MFQWLKCLSKKWPKCLSEKAQVGAVKRYTERCWFDCYVTSRYRVFYNLCYEPWSEKCIKCFDSKVTNIVFLNQFKILVYFNLKKSSPWIWAQFGWKMWGGQLGAKQWRIQTKRLGGQSNSGAPKRSSLA